jgi:hypothetical protein
MAINFPSEGFNPAHLHITRSSTFRVQDLEALKSALRHYPNIILRAHDERNRIVGLTTRDGTWMTNFDHHREVCCLDEILVNHLMEGETVHLYQINVSDDDHSVIRYSMHYDGQWYATTNAEDEQYIVDTFKNPKRASA